ncbi:hydroxycarboxylic acid receptor 2-like [Melanotaenia boesemani]|uniref:hydroxycarboxylic acid receptor 2-like n=1 Tax=Melanotaenia boesemani TaxID=1250792 RepID=UPI001C04F811|nr:hydroxycarboxylic acid receptor 2-like [Melanotaenia boesemani]XP_041830437.1 hydroxycarboxylic acid receptor 2-like [Melanotaenia boesemani]
MNPDPALLDSNTMTPESNFTPVPDRGCPSVSIQLEGLILPPVITIDIILGLLGNIVALWIFLFKLKAWNPNIVFLFNLVIADFLVLVSLPLRLHTLLRGYWVFGDGLCRINLFLMFTDRTASIALMTVVAVYRYFKVVHPHHRFNRMTKRQAAVVSVFVWLLVISPRVPLLAYSHIEGSGDKTRCAFFSSYKEERPAVIILVAMHRILTVLEFILPLALLLFCSIRISRFLKKRQMGKPEKVRKAVRVCAAIVAVFTLCFLPTTVTTIGVWVIRSYLPWDCTAFYTFIQLNIVSFGFNFLNSALDPIIYVFSSSMFRKALLAALPRWLLCRRDEGGNAASSSSSSGTKSTDEQELKQMNPDNELI